jgi:hypothetical protein
MGFWNSLTLQGKIAIAAGVLGGLFLLSLAYGNDSGGSPTDEGPGFQNTVVVGQSGNTLFATNTPVSNSLFATNTPVPTQVPTASPPTETPVPPPPTIAAAVPTRVPTQVPTPLPPEDTPVPPPPTATPAGGCRVSASVTGGDTVTASMTCSGSAVGQGAPMTATFNYANLSSGCSALGNASGTASCTARLTTEPGPLRSVDVCMTATAGRVCTSVQ